MLLFSSICFDYAASVKLKIYISPVLPVVKRPGNLHLYSSDGTNAKIILFFYGQD